MPKTQTIEELTYITHAFGLTCHYLTESGNIVCKETCNYDGYKPRSVRVPRDFSNSLDADYFRAAIAWMEKHKVKYEHAQIVAYAYNESGITFFYRH